MEEQEIRAQQEDHPVFSEYEAEGMMSAALLKIRRRTSFPIVARVDLSNCLDHDFGR